MVQLHDLAIASLKIGPGDEVIMPTFTIISCASAVIRAGAIPVLIDADPITWNMNIKHIEASITSKTAAIMAVHIYGLPVDMDPILNIAEKFGIYVIEDAAELIGAKYKGMPCGSFGDVSTFSFYPNKHITTGEGGMIVTNDPNIKERCKSLRNLCFQKNNRFIHKELGWNYRMSNIQAALGIAQLERLDENIKRKLLIGSTYNKFLKNIYQLTLPVKETSYAENIYWVYGIILDKSLGEAKHIMEKLKSLKIGTRPFFYPMHKQPVFREMGLFKDQKLEISENLFKYGFYLPSGLTLNKDDIKLITDKLKSILIK